MCSKNAFNKCCVGFSFWDHIFVDFEMVYFCMKFRSFSPESYSIKHSWLSILFLMEPNELLISCATSLMVTSRFLDHISLIWPIFSYVFDVDCRKSSTNMLRCMGMSIYLQILLRQADLSQCSHSDCGDCGCYSPRYQNFQFPLIIF